MGDGGPQPIGLGSDTMLRIVGGEKDGGYFLSILFKLI
jgi:hypothetical protein